ncbi:MAG TPA: nitrilase-related carbon-nitrogen hydrolase, partial [Egibacteraceae bacterium]|nr:nitrilase-related carbon-nitrogen hydrolase [Egibacteraceae bacterium]
LHNTAVAFSASGELLAAYRKIHLFGYQSLESELLTAGGDVCVFDAEGARIGLSTCYDLFPELYRAQIDQGADVLAVVSAWPFPRIDAWHTLARARAIESQAGLIACNAAGGRYLGHSCAFDAWGAVLGELDERAGTLRADLDVAEIRKARAEFPALADRRLG